MILKKYLLYSLLFLLILTVVYSLILVIIEFKRRRYINDFILDINNKYRERQRAREKQFLYEGYTSENKFIDKVDNAIEKANLRVLFPFLTAEILITISIIIATIASYITHKAYNYWLYSIGSFFIIIFIITLTLKYMGRYTFDKIDDQLLLYINTLLNLTSTNDDIVAIINKSLPYIKSPLKEYSQQFVFEAQKGISLEKAFKHFEDKVDSKRFKQLIKNMYISSKLEANYKTILNKSRVIMNKYFEEKGRRKKAVRDGRLVILATLVVGIFLFQMTSSFTENLMETLKTSIIGNLILSYLFIVVVYAIYKFITLDRLNY